MSAADAGRPGALHDSTTLHARTSTSVDLFPARRPPARRALTAVCKRWAGVVWATPALWRELRIHAGAQLVAAPDDLARWAAAKGVLLRRAAPLLESLQLSTCEPAVPGGPTGEQCQLAAVHLAVLLSGLAPAVQLTRLELGAWGLALAPAHLRALAALPRLQQLTIQWPSSEQQLQVVLTTSPGRATLLSADGGHDLAAAVARMTGLQRLALPVASVPGPLVPAIAGLPQLSCLVLSSQQPLPAAVTSLAAAPALKELRLHEREERDDGGLPLPGAAARLSTLHVAAPSIEVRVPAGVCACWRASLLGQSATRRLGPASCAACMLLRAPNPAPLCLADRRGRTGRQLLEPRGACGGGAGALAGAQGLVVGGTRVLPFRTWVGTRADPFAAMCAARACTPHRTPLCRSAPAAACQPASSSTPAWSAARRCWMPWRRPAGAAA